MHTGSSSYGPVGAMSGSLAVLSSLISAAPLPPAQALVVACVFGPALMCALMGASKRFASGAGTVSLDLGLTAKVAAGVVDLFGDGRVVHAGRVSDRVVATAQPGGSCAGVWATREACTRACTMASGVVVNRCRSWASRSYTPSSRSTRS